MRGCKLEGIQGATSLRGVAMRWDDIVGNAGDVRRRAGHRDRRLASAQPSARSGPYLKLKLSRLRFSETFSIVTVPSPPL